MNKQRFPARGPRGEAVIIIRTGDQPHGQEVSEEVDMKGSAYWLASGERLHPTEDPRVFQDGNGRQFRLN